MALSTVGFGLKPINKLGSNYNSTGVTEYRAYSYGGFGLAHQMPVSINTMDGGIIISPTYSKTHTLGGSFVGVQYDDPNTNKPIFADHVVGGNNGIRRPDNFDFSTAPSMFVYDDPFQMYLMKIDGDLTLSNIKGNYRPNASQDTAGTSVSDDFKRSIVKLDSSTRSAQSYNAFRFVMYSLTEGEVSFASRGVDGSTTLKNNILAENSDVVVAMNRSVYKAGTKASTNA